MAFTYQYVPLKDIEPVISAEGEPSIMIWQAFPFLKNFYLQYERDYMSVPAVQAFIRAHPEAPIIACICYAIMIFGGRRIMRDRPAFDLKGPLAAWNLFLGVFSIIGAVRTVPYLFYWLSTIGFKQLNCTVPSYTHGDRDVGLWAMLFGASKFIELIDTLFIVLRKKPLIFLHWYHHLTVLVFTYYACAYRHAGLFFIAMNYSVHSVMYTYFYLMAVKAVPKWFNPLWITLAQISQMFVGVFVTGASTYYKWTEGCQGAQWPLLAGSMLIYASYFYLFVEFAVMRFVLIPRRQREKAAKMQLKRQATGDFTPVGLEEVRQPSLRLVQSSSYSIEFELDDNEADAMTADGDDAKPAAAAAVKKTQ